MATFIALLVGVICLGFIIGPIIYFQSRKVLREQKNFERGLKMVPLIIHLPPPSADTDTNNRDIRDVTDENISKAQILYSILASTFEKNFKRHFYGQRHISFEIVAHSGRIDFFTAVPIGLVDLVKQAIISAYPSARLEEALEPNIFSKLGRISGTLGGELTLKEKYAYPIATYQDLKRDPLQSLLNSLSTLDKDDGAAIQFLLRPARPGWAKDANEVASKKRKGDEKKKGVKGFMEFFNDMSTALSKPPEDKGPSSGPPGSNLSPHEQAILDSIDEKTRTPGFETTIRVIASSNVVQRAQSIQGNMVASFGLYNAPGKNGFKFTPAQDIESFVTAYIMRFFPQHHDSNILNSVELATLFHFPQQEDIPTSQLVRQDSKQVDGPRNVPEHGLLLGYNVFRGTKRPIRLALEDRQRHIYAVGQTGTGKSTFLENLALQDMQMGNGFAFIDPHGDTAEKLLSMVPKERTEDVIYFCPADTDYPMGLNVFEAKTDDQKDFVIQEVINVLYKLYDPQKQGIIGPRYESLFRNAALTVMAGPEGGSFVDIPKLFRDKDYVNQKLKYVTDQNVLDFWQKEMVQAQKSNEFGDVVSWFVSKFGAFLSNGMMRNIIGQTKSAFDLRDIMDNKKILIVNLSKGRTGDMNSNLLGMIFVMKFQSAAMSRANIPEKDRQDFCLYVDEFQNFSTDSFATILSEARKYRLNLVVANQFTTQLTEEIRDAVFGNVGTTVAFRVGQNDVDGLTRYFQPLFDADDLLRVPNWNAIVRTLIHGVPTQAFSMAGSPPLGEPHPELGDALKQLSAAKYARPRQIVEKEIFERMHVKETAPAAPAQGFGQGTRPTQGQGAAGRPFGAAAQPNPYGGPSPAPASRAPAGYGPPPGAAAAGPPGSGSSFLDQWLDKRRKTQGPAPAPAAGPVNPSAAQPQPQQPSTAVFHGAPVPTSSLEQPQPGTAPPTPQRVSDDVQPPAFDTPSPASRPEPLSFAAAPQKPTLPPAPKPIQKLKHKPEPASEHQSQDRPKPKSEPKSEPLPPQPKNDQTHPVGELQIRTADPSSNSGASVKHHEDTIHIKR